MPRGKSPGLQMMLPFFGIKRMKMTGTDGGSVLRETRRNMFAASIRMAVLTGMAVGNTLRYAQYAPRS